MENFKINFGEGINTDGGDTIFDAFSKYNEFIDAYSRSRFNWI